MSDIIQVVFKKGVLFDICVSRWNALHQMKSGDLLLEKLNRKVIYPGHKKLLPEDVSYGLQHIETKIRSFVAKRSMPFPIAGVVFVSYKALPAMLEGLKVLRKELKDKAQELYDQYDTIKMKQIDVLDEEAVKIAEKNGLFTGPMTERKILENWLHAQHSRHLELYPDKEKLLTKYDVTWSMFKVNPLDTNDATLIGEEEAQVIAEQQKQLKEGMENWVKEQSINMHKKLGQACAQAMKMLQDNGKLNPKNLKPLFSAFEEFQAVDLVGSSFQTQIKAVKDKYIQNGSTIQDMAAAVNNSTEEFNNLVSVMAGLAVDEVAKQAGANALASSDFKRIVEI